MLKRNIIVLIHPRVEQQTVLFRHATQTQYITTLEVGKPEKRMFHFVECALFVLAFSNLDLKSFF